MRRRQFILALSCLPLLSVAQAVPGNEPIIGLPCEGCEAVFVGIPATLSSQSRIAPMGEPGEPLQLAGVVLGADGAPRAGVIVYAYQTNAAGIYPTGTHRLPGWAGRHGRLRGWARTDAQGRYNFNTIRPGSYPGRNIPQHIHMHVIEPGRATYYIDDVMFTDDPKLTLQRRKELATGRGGTGVITPVRRDGGWLARRNIILGLGIPGYPDSPVP